MISIMTSIVSCETKVPCVSHGLYQIVAATSVLLLSSCNHLISLWLTVEILYLFH
jgi:hypothetical protein